MIDACGNTISNFSSITEAEQLTGIHKGNIARSVRQGYMAGRLFMEGGKCVNSLQTQKSKKN